ncbi:hypothetical protein D3C71_1586530 [compost metagenome]
MLVIQLQRQRAGELLLLQIVTELRITQQVENVLAIVFRPAETQQMLRQPVAPKDIAFDGSHHYRIGQRFRSATEAFDQQRQLTAPTTVPLLHLIQAVKQRFPAPAARRRRHAAVNPQPVGKFELIVEIPYQRRQHGGQQQPGQITKNQPQQ